MDISPLSPTNPNAANPAAPASAASAQISSDFEVFLQMLTAQMQYQDPLNPIDSTDYATQLATFSGVEQAVLTNDLLKSLTTQMNTGGLVDMAALVGKEVRSTAPAYFDGAPITLLPTRSSISDTAELIVRDDAGVEVQRLAVQPSTDSIVWAGVGPNGAPLPAGLYSFEVVGQTNGQLVEQGPIEVYSTVTEVRLEGDQTKLILSGGASIPSDQVTALREARP